jgi:hypothetical protein
MTTEISYSKYQQLSGGEAQTMEREVQRKVNAAYHKGLKTATEKINKCLEEQGMPANMFDFTIKGDADESVQETDQDQG